MKKSTLYHLLKNAIIQNWREVTGKNTNECFKQQKNKLKATILNILSENCQKLYSILGD